MNKSRVLAILSAAAISVSGLSISAPAAVRAEAKVGQLRLISAGVDYILAEERFSLKDVENEVTALKAAQEAAAQEQAAVAEEEQAANTRAAVGASMLSAGLDLSPIDPLVESIPEEVKAAPEQAESEAIVESAPAAEETAESAAVEETTTAAGETEQTAETASVTSEAEQTTKEQTAASEETKQETTEAAEAKSEAEEVTAPASEETAKEETAPAAEEEKKAGLRDLLKNPSETAEEVIGGTEKIIVDIAAEETISVDQGCSCQAQTGSMMALQPVLWAMASRERRQATPPVKPRFSQKPKV